MLLFERLYAVHPLLLAIMDENVVQLLRASTESTALIQNRTVSVKGHWNSGSWISCI